jgi:hypothetical protein
MAVPLNMPRRVAGVSGRTFIVSSVACFFGIE